MVMAAGLGNINLQGLLSASRGRSGANTGSRADVTAQTALGEVNFGPGSGASAASFRDIDSLIRSRGALGAPLVSAGASEALRLSGLGEREAFNPLGDFTSLASFREQQALLGTEGEEAQREAISGIPVSDFDRELQRRQQQTQLRQAAATGELGSGATIQAAQQLAGGQQADIIQRRLAELEPLVAISRGARTARSEIEEAAFARQAQILSGRGTQLANIRLGATAPIIESTLQQANLSGLRGISAANQRAGQAQQLAQIAGKFAPQIGNFFAPQQQSTAALQTGFQTNFVPEAGTIGVA
jgi:hypothetical protein